jgi:hypothetical protein
MPNDNQPSSIPTTPPGESPMTDEVPTPKPEETPTLPGPTPEESSEELSAGLGASRMPAIVAAIVAFVLLLVLVIFGVLLYNHPVAAARLRDIFIILLGIQSIFIGLLMIVAVVAIIYVALKMYDLTQFIQNELRPMLQRADDTMRTVHSRTVFISDTAVKPVIDVMSWGAAVRGIIRAFTQPQK